MTTATTTSDPYTQWIDLSDHEITLAHVNDLLGAVDDDVWVAAECLDKLVDTVEIQRSLLEHGISRTDSAVERAKASLAREHTDDTVSSHGEDTVRRALDAYFASESRDAQLCQFRQLLLLRLDRLHTFEEICGRGPTVVTTSTTTEEKDGWEDDPWTGDGSSGIGLDGNSRRGPSSQQPMALSLFLQQDITLLCFALAASMQFKALELVMQRHASDVSHCKLAILERIPAYASLTDYHSLLPSVDTAVDLEGVVYSNPPRSSPDWVEIPFVQQALQSVGVGPAEDCTYRSVDSEDQTFTGSAQDIDSWYRNRVDTILETTEMVDMAIDLVQHAISLGVQGLDEVGEDLTLISRLVYDSPGGYKGSTLITPNEWRSREPLSIIQEYLRHSTPDSIVDDIRRLVHPYIFVLEARADRAGQPDRGFCKRYFYDFILSAPLDIIAPIFEASKPTIVTSKRLIADDEDLARLALACLYGNGSLDEWATMSRIFECLPAWNFSVNNESGEADAVVAFLNTALAPSTATPRRSPAELYAVFATLNARSLSRMLDILDIHLESGEILARWNTGVPLHWFLQSSSSEVQQRSCATTMARQAEVITSDLLSEDEWSSLLDDMLKISRHGEVDTNTAFGLLRENEIKEIFFSGLLSAGKFSLAKNLLEERVDFLDADVIERICLECSREVYDNANSGNLHSASMRSAFECLAVAHSTPTIQKEREFIEATSRISSFNLMSQPGVPILPIEIRLTKDKLSLVSRIVSSNENAYKHTEVILDLTRKLGYQGDVLAEVKTLAMIADTALQAEDFVRAFEANERMIEKVLQLQSSRSMLDQVNIKEAADVCWVACFQLGRYPDEENVRKRMELLGRSLELCPPDKIADILTAWRKLEVDVIKERQPILGGNTTRQPRLNPTLHRSLAAKLQNMHLSSPSLRHAAPDAAAFASHAFSRVAANFPFSIGRHPEHGQDISSPRPQRSGSPDVQSQARHALQKGIGWLIGADEDDL